MLKQIKIQSLAAVAVLASFSTHAEPAAPPDQVATTQAEAIVQDRALVQAQAVHWQDIKGWRALGTRWAAALNAQGAVIALYDLAFPDWAHQIHSLGVVGKHTGNMSSLLQLLRAERAQSPKDVDKALNALAQVKAGPLVDGKLPTSWWKRIPWKGTALMRSQGTEPESFTLADIDFAAMETEDAYNPAAQEKLTDMLARAETLSEGSDEDPILGPGFLSHFEYVRQADGLYQLNWHGSQAPGSVTRPRKAADLLSPRENYYRELSWSALETLLGAAIGQIPVPIVAALLDTAFDRFFHFQSLLRGTHADMLLESVASMSENCGQGNPLCGFLTPTEQLLASQSLVMMDATWPWTSPSSQLDKEHKDDVSNAASSAAWLLARYNFLASFNPRFAVLTEDNPQQLYMLSATKLNAKKGPAVGVDSANPDVMYRHRLFIEELSTAVAFGTNFIPFGGFIVSDLYKHFVEDPEDNARRWEGRLFSHLETRTGWMAHEDWSGDMALIERQRINRFDLNEADSLALAHDRRVSLGLNP